MNNHGANCYFDEKEFARRMEQGRFARMPAETAEVKRKKWSEPFPNGVIPDMPPRIYSTLEWDGCRIGFVPMWEVDGLFAGWSIEVENRVKYQMRCIDNALQYALQTHDTFECWRGIVPADDACGQTVYRDRVELLRLCPIDCVERFVEQAVRNGFTAVVRKDCAGGAGVPEAVEMRGVRVEIVPRLSYAGALIGWGILFCNPMARHIAKIDGVLIQTFSGKSTSWRWHELNPAASGFGNPTIARTCSGRETDRFARHARIAGFHPVTDWPEA